MIGFLDALADPEFALKILERHPEYLDSALRIALQLEVWTKDSARLCQNERYEAKKTREVTGPKTTSQERINEALRNEVDEQRKKIAELEQQLAKRPALRPLAEATNNQRINCWRCGGAGHTIRDCPTKPRSNEDRTRTYEARKEQPKDVRPIREKQVKTCIVVKFRHHHISALLDTGSDISIAGNEVAEKYNWQIHPHHIKTVKVANDEEMITYGAARIPLRVGKRSVDSEVLISPDLNGLILGIDCMEKYGQFVWDFREQRTNLKTANGLNFRKRTNPEEYEKYM